MKESSSPDLIRTGLAALNLGPADLPERSIRPFASGIFQTYRIDLDHPLLAKVHPFAMAEAELDGLRALEHAGLRVPTQHGLFRSGQTGVLFMELIEGGRPDLSIFLRGMFPPAECWGYSRDNFIGSLVQKNGRYATFSQFWWETRIEPQLNLAIKTGLLTGADARSAEAIVQRRAAEWRLDESKPCLVHGDLWRGNILFDRKGETILIDPAVSWSHPEQDLAMLELFGSPANTDTLERIALELRLEPGRQERTAFFQLYPLLVHVNLFGAGYVSDVRRALKQYA